MHNSTIDNQKEYWDKVASKKIFTHQLNIDLLSKYITEESNIVDYGCGYGRLTAVLLDAGYKNIKGFDTSIELINRGKNTFVAALFHIDGPDNLPVLDNSVDCILLFAVLTCIPSNKGQTTLINMLHAKLKPGAVLYISDYYIQENKEEVSRYAYLNDDKANFGTFTLPEGATFRHHQQQWIRTLLTGFTIKEENIIDVHTMNGYAAKAFQMIVQK